MKSKCCDSEVRLIKEVYYQPHFECITNICSACNRAYEVKDEDKDELNATIKAMGLIMR